VACGPFPSLSPGQSIDFALALVAAPDPDSLKTNLGNAAFLYHGTKLNLLPDSSGTDFHIGATGKGGHEVCIEPPPGVEFDYDPSCPQVIADMTNTEVPEIQVHYSHGHCVWTNADCDFCTGIGGFETILRWLDPGSVPPVPAYHVAGGDHAVRVAWDNQPEILLNAGIAGAGGYGFAGYHVYRLSNWARESLLPPPQQWEQIGAYGPDTLNGQQPLAAVTDSTVGYDLIAYRQRHYPIGRYRVVDRKVLNGFDYLYLVTTVGQRTVTLQGGGTRVEQIESPLVATIDSIVVPHVTAAGGAGGGVGGAEPVPGGRGVGPAADPRGSVRAARGLSGAAGGAVHDQDLDAGGGPGGAAGARRAPRGRAGGVEPDLAQRPGRGVGDLPVHGRFLVRPPGRPLRHHPVT